MTTRPAHEHATSNRRPLLPSLLLPLACALGAAVAIDALPAHAADDPGPAAQPEGTAAQAPHEEQDRESAPTVGGESVTFRLGPASGTSFIQLLHTQRDRSMEGVGKEEARAIGRTRYAVHRTEDGWTYTGRLVSSETTRDGKRFDDPYGLVLADVEVEIDVGDDGAVRAVRGYDGVAARARKLLSPEIAEQLQPFMGADALEARAVSDWRGRIGDFVGLTVSIGDSRTERLSYELPGGLELEYDVETRFAGWAACPAGQCLRIETSYDSAPSREATLRNAASGDDVEQSRIAGSSTRLVDPSTMLIYSEEEERTVWATLQIEGLGPVPLVEVATMTYSYEYQ